MIQAMKGCLVGLKFEGDGNTNDSVVNDSETTYLQRYCNHNNT